MPDKPQLFGTDGVRGVAGEYPLDQPTITKLGRALGLVLGKSGAGRPLRVVLGEDTRESSAWISRAIAAGLKSSGAEVSYAGVITTPGVAFLARHHGFAAGVMISASHNPYADNGVKVLSSSGTKLAESQELEIEAALKGIESASAHAPEEGLEPAQQWVEDYVKFLVGLSEGIRGTEHLRLVVDCANGASSRIVPELMKRLGIQVKFIGDTPDGKNINLDCGSLHPDKMASLVKSSGADLGVAFDGDADRAIFATEDGRVADGDHVLFGIAPFFKESGKLKGDGVVGTLMTNLGLELALAEKGIELRRTAVGDKYVLEEMVRSGINVGGEPSGHIIFSDISHAGDGIVTMLQVLRLIGESDRPLGKLVKDLKQFPQVIKNVKVREKKPLDSMPQVAQAIDECAKALGRRGRVVVRYSGTERLARVMVEAEKAEVVEHHAARIVEAIQQAIGAH